MRIFARNVVLAKSRFWYFMKRLNKARSCKLNGHLRVSLPGQEEWRRVVGTVT